MAAYICTLTQAIRLEWTAVPFINNNNRLQFTTTTPSENRVLTCGSSVQCADLDYQATLTSVGPVQNGLADMTSTFRFTASARVNGTVVQCIESTATGIQRANSTLIVAGGLLA